MAQGEPTRGAEAAAAGHHQACHHHDHDHASRDRAKPTADACCGGAHGGAANQDAEVAIDPVCGMKVKPETAKHRLEYQGQEYLFCGARCRERFQADPEKFLKPKAGQALPAPKRQEPAGTIYTCPMHPEIRQVGPGTCPICGMALEPVQVSLDAGPDPELLDMTQRFWIALVLTAPVFAIEMGGHFGRCTLFRRQVAGFQLALSTPVVLWAGWPFLSRGWRSVVSRHLNMFTLIAMGTGVAYLYSLIGTLCAAASSRPVSATLDGAVAVYFEAAAVITVLVLLGQVLELRARERTAGAIRALLDLAPKTARRIRDGGDDEDVALRCDQGRRSAARAARRGDSGRRRLSRRTNAVDESLVTGEPMPVAKTDGALSGARSMAPARWCMRAEQVGRTPCWRGSSHMVARGATQRVRRSSGLPIASPAGSCRW